MLKLLLVASLCLLSLSLMANQLTHSDIAHRFSPEINQGLGSDPRGDEFTRVDFDGDWNPENNWENMPKFDRPRVVYFDVIESERHYFITYSFFFPRDYEKYCFWVLCHENDFEGMRVTVDKISQKPIKLEALAHNFKSQVQNPPSVAVVIESCGHGVHPASIRAPEDKHKIYRPGDYQLRPLGELWDKRDTTLFTGSFAYGDRRYPANFGGKKWIPFGMGAAKPPWAWEIFRSDIKKR